MSDELLVIRCRLGEREAFAELVRAWHERVERYVSRMLGRPDDDVVQEIWLAVVKGLPRLRQPDRFAPWLYSIARRAVMNRLRDSYTPPVTSDVLSPFSTLDDDVLDRQVIAAALGALPPREREVLMLFHLEDLPLQACAEICDVPVGTIKSRLNRARRLLHEELLSRGGSC
ncbi:RNA polymerase sigma factor [Actinoplanes solisilvae]|uniref:RNA polymerase sigma factor n=1 Tax=Actinoplanes solisilvae TaxID=2486853 RepID=UPI000FD73034|nr:sigma-70 family RNA polymerase sigma factor [Actinoplanes solisilvae]